MNRKNIIAACLFSFAAGAVAQNVTTPYSMYGYGVLSDRATSMQRQMGSVGYAMNSGRQVNVMNPAAYAAMDSLTFLFDMGADVSMLWQKEGKAREHTTGGGLDYVTMQFPLSKFMGASIGLLPYSSVGYAFGQEIQHGAMETQGSGGINQAYIGVAGKVGGFSLGANVAYSFGTILNDHYTTITSGTQTLGTSLIEHVLQVRDWDLWLGAQYTASLNRHDRMVVGATFTPKKSLHGNTWVTKQETTQQSVPDTLASMKVGGNYYTPMGIGAGVSFSHERNSKWMVEADVTFQEWSKVKYSPLYSNTNPKDLVFEGMKFRNRIRYAVGGEYVPNIRGNYLQNITYRLGAYYNEDYLQINGNHVREVSVSGGFGFPVAEGKTLVNLGVEWKRRAASPASLITENYLNITLGVNFNELWFWQRKIK